MTNQTFSVKEIDQGIRALQTVVENARITSESNDDEVVTEVDFELTEMGYEGDSVALAEYIVENHRNPNR